MPTDIATRTRDEFTEDLEDVVRFLNQTSTLKRTIAALDYYRAASRLRTLADTAQRIADAYAGPLNAD